MQIYGHLEGIPVNIYVHCFGLVIHHDPLYFLAFFFGGRHLGSHHCDFVTTLPGLVIFFPPDVGHFFSNAPEKGQHIYSPEN